MVRHGFSSGNKKIVIVGSACSGKTATIKRYITGQFPSDYLQTFGSELYVKSTNENKKYTLQIWCCGGHERYRALLEQFYVEANSPPSFQEAGFWYNEAKRCVPDALVILVGTKADDVDTSIVKMQDVMKVSKDWGVDFRTVSAKTGQNVEDLFDHVIAKFG